MNRVEKFRQNRQLKLKIWIAFIFFLVIILTGIAVADYSVNSIMRNERRIEIFSIKEVSGTLIQISIMNQKLDINTKYIKRDYGRLMDFLQR